MWLERLEKWLGIALLVVTLGTLVLASVGSVLGPIGTDEGYNLEVIDNLAKGVGYASYGNRRLDTWWSAKHMYSRVAAGEPTLTRLPEPWFFEPRVTTGPAVLLPLAAVWRLFPGNVILLRSCLIGFLLILLAALWVAAPGPKRWLNFAIAASIVSSYRFGPGAVLGDVAAVGFFSWACIYLERQRVFVAGLLFGLAFQSKMITITGFLGVVCVVVLAAVIRRDGILRKLLLLCIGCAVPLIAFELYRLGTLGSMAKYMASWQEYFDFIHWRTGFASKTRFYEKLHYLWLYGPGIAFAGAAMLILVKKGYEISRMVKKDGWEVGKNVVGTVPVLLAAGGLPIILVWLLYSEQAGPRQMLPGAILLFAGLALLHLRAVPAFDALNKRSRGSTFVTVAIILFALGGVTKWVYHFWRHSGSFSLLAEQMAAAAALRSSGAESISAVASPYEPYPVLSGLRVSPCPWGKQALVVTQRQEAAGKSRDGFRHLCSDVLWESSEAFICLMKPPQDLEDDLSRLEVSDWGPKTVVFGTVGDRRGDERVAFWFRLAAPLPNKPRLIFLADGKAQALITWSADGDWFSASVGKEKKASPGPRTLAVLEPCSGRVKTLGRVMIEDGN